MNYNRVMLGGNITRELELRYTPKGTAVLEIGLAVNRKWRDAEGQTREDTTFVECRAWGRQAEVIAEQFYKGRPIFIEGRLALEEWEDKETGKKRRKTLVIVGLGCALGVPLGDALGRWFSTLYTQVFTFPQLQHRLRGDVLAVALGLSVAVGLLATAQAIRSGCRAASEAAIIAPVWKP